MFKKLPNTSSSKTRNALGNNGFFDLKMGTAGAFVMGAAVYFVNAEYGFTAAFIAALKQGGYTFLIGGTMVRISENMAVYFENPVISKIMAVLVPSILTLGLTFFVHSLKGTPEPLASTVPTLLLAPPSFAVWGHKKRKQLDKLTE